MIHIENLEKCTGCEACINICPRKCIHLVAIDGFYYPEVDIDQCIGCNLCEKVCPMQNSPEYCEKTQYGIVGYIKDEAARFNSTSGGAAYLIGKTLIDQGGVAYGVAFDDEFQSIFIRVESMEGLTKLQGSKYPQSKVGSVHAEIKKDLCKGNQVVFFGTPCQVAGVRQFLGKQYDNLILVDLICHGVPSPLIWQSYLNEKFPDEQITKVVFKHKKNGWKNWRVYIRTSNQEYSQERLKDTYMSSYLCGYNVRPSCFSCQFKGNNRVADITIADAWGIPEKDTEMNDGKGLSTLIVNSSKGMNLLDSMKNEMVWKEYSFEDLIVGNPAYSYVIQKNLFYKRFWKKTQKRKVLKVLKKYAIGSLYGKLMLKVSKFILERGRNHE